IMLERRRLKEEKARLAQNMQYFLDLEEVKINDKRTYPRVRDVEIGFRGDYNHPYITFFITFTGELRAGLNIYEDSYEPEIAEYDYKVYWVLPTKARIVRADLGVLYEVRENGRILEFSVEKGMEIRGYERIEFELSP
ncbi:MAG: hypothetical protein QXL28_00870, partial [Desulfurococcaceae archaeon]